MRLLVACLLACAALVSPARAAEPAPAEAAELVVRVEPARCVVGQPVRVTLEVRYHVAHFAAHAATLFRRPLDLEVELRAPWLKRLEGAAVVPQEPFVVNPPTISWLRVALDGEAASLPSQPTERAGWARLVTGCTLIPREAGALVLAAPTLRYAHALRIEENLLGERTAREVTPITITGEALRIPVEEPPAAGRPDGWAGVVGRYEVQARVDVPEVTVGEPFELEVLFTGEGNLGLLERPRLDDVPGLHVYGAREAPGEDEHPALVTRRVVRYEVALTDASLAGIPPIPLAYYDPASGYGVARSAPVPLRVRPAATEAPAPGAESPPGADAPRATRRPPLALVGLAGLAALLLVGGGAVLLWRVRPWRPDAAAGAARGAVASRPQAAPAGADRAETTRALAAALGDGEAVYPAYVAYLAAHLGCGPGAVVGPSLRARLDARGVPAALAARAAEAMDGLVAARYGGAATAGPDRALVDALTAALRTRP